MVYIDGSYAIQLQSISISAYHVFSTLFTILQESYN